MPLRAVHKPLDCIQLVLSVALGGLSPSLSIGRWEFSAHFPELRVCGFLGLGLAIGRLLILVE